MPPAPAPQAIIAIHDQGYAEIALADFEATARITLQPWGRVEGSFVLDSQLVANETIVAVNQVCRYDEGGRRFALRTLRLETKTDSAGKFSFEKVMPGKCNIFWQKDSPREPRAGFDSHETSIVVNAGETTQVTLGGSGRLIVGKARLSGAAGTMDWQGVPVHLKSKLANDPGPRPKRDDFSSSEAFIEVMDCWMETVHSQRTFGAFCDSHGSFRLLDIPAGTYELEIKLRDAKANSLTPARDPDRAVPELGSLVREITVPEIQTGQSAEPLDLGTLELVPTQEQASAP